MLGGLSLKSCELMSLKTVDSTCRLICVYTSEWYVKIIISGKSNFVTFDILVESIPYKMVDE